jgi:hypothetical protein
LHGNHIAEVFFRHQSLLDLVIRHAQADEAFFSIDEFGPFAVKMKGGRKLVGPAENFTVPQWQKSKGCLIITAALELSTNQVTHFYSNKKNTDMMIKMMNLLIKRYKGFRKLWLSWDAASWHMSKKLYEQIKAANAMANITGSPTVETAPVPPENSSPLIIMAFFFFR